MARKVILAVVLIGVLAWTVMCGRSRSSEISDTPVPTLTPVPTSAPTATQTATAVVMPTPTQVSAAMVVTPTIEVSAVMTMATAQPLTTTLVLTGSSAPTSTQAVAETPPITASTVVTGVTPVAESPSITSSAAVTPQATLTSSTGLSETAPISVSQMPTITSSGVASARITATPVPFPSPTISVTETVSATPALQSSMTPTTTVTITGTPAVKVEPTLTITSTGAPPKAILTPAASTTPRVTATITTSTTTSSNVEAAVEPAKTPEATVAATAEITVEAGTATILPRQAITLPTRLATSIQITGMKMLTDVVANALPMAAELSPDGKMVAWIVPAEARKQASLCVASVVGGGQNCFTAAGFQGLPYQLVWSPDSQWIAFSEDPAAQAMESDIWLFDVTNGMVGDRTDDAVQGRYADATDDYALDYLPMWDPATGYLYFWRSTPDKAGGFTLDLMRLDPKAEGEAELVRSFGKSLGDGLVRFGWQRFYLQGPSAIAPDGSRLAVLIAPAQEMDLSAKHALWLIDLENPQAEPQQLATSLSWQSGLPQWSSQPAVGRGLQWTADGKGIVVAALSSDLRLPLLLPYYVDVASGKATPVVDFSSSGDRESFFRMDPTSLKAPRMDVPWTVAMAPNSNVLLLITDLAGGMRVLAAPLPPNGSEPMEVGQHRSPGFEAWTRSSASSEGKVLVDGMLLQLAPN